MAARCRRGSDRIAGNEEEEEEEEFIWVIRGHGSGARLRILIHTWLLRVFNCNWGSFLFFSYASPHKNKTKWRPVNKLVVMLLSKFLFRGRSDSWLNSGTTWLARCQRDRDFINSVAFPPDAIC